jgi:hypothetical protein
VDELLGTMEEIESGMGVLNKPAPSNFANRQIPTRAGSGGNGGGNNSASSLVVDDDSKTPVMQMAEEMIQAMKDEEAQKALRGITVYSKSFEPNNIIGEIVISPITTVEEMMQMIQKQLGVAPGGGIKKKNIPIAKTQWSHKAFEFFRSHEDYAVVHA